MDDIKIERKAAMENVDLKAHLNEKDSYIMNLERQLRELNSSSSEV